MESIVGQDQKETEEVPQSGRGADGMREKSLTQMSTALNIFGTF
jgi:hypothetical protein